MKWIIEVLAFEAVRDGRNQSRSTTRAPINGCTARITPQTAT
jgi:hypothetical protein